MSDQTTINPHAGGPGTIVVHAGGATHFGAVGAPVPPTAQMGVAEQQARELLGHRRSASVRREPRQRAGLRLSAIAIR
jgi:hypothetical protein